jgi:hypothetical protein
MRVADQTWTDLTSGATGRVDARTRAWADAELVFSGRRMPAASRAELRRDLDGPRHEVDAVAALLPAARSELEHRRGRAGQQAEGEWVAETIGRFEVNQVPVATPVAARLLADMELLPLRDVAWSAMDADNAVGHMALWRDLTRRAPVEARAAPATLLAFSSWLAGQGAHAWVALDLVPQPEEYSLARIVTALLENAIAPAAWESIGGRTAGPAFDHVLQRGQLTRPEQPRPASPPTVGPDRDRPSSPGR